MAKTIAAYGGGFKPPTKGHLEVVKRALEQYPEIDELTIYVGGGTRDGLTQAESILIWEIFQSYLPMKVKIEPSKAPIGDVIRLGKNNPQDKFYFIIGGREGREDDMQDIESRTKGIEEKYPNIEVKIIQTPDQGMSGTNARKAAKVSAEEFFKYLPDELTDEEKDEVYNIVKPAIQEMLNENASYSKDIDYKSKIKDLTVHMLTKGWNIVPLPKVVYVDGDTENAREFLGKTAYYDPNTQTIVLYTEGRHPKDIVRSYAHEMVHHQQNIEGKLGDIQTTNTQEDDKLNDIEAEANLKGTMTFRNWTDSLQEKKNKDPFGLNAYARELVKSLEEELEEGRKKKKDPKKGTGKKPEGSGRRLYTDEDPSDTVGIKFKTKEDIVDTLNKASFKAKSHARQSQIINLIHQRVRAAYGKAKDPETKARLKRGLDYIEKRKEASKEKTKRLQAQKENVIPKQDEKAAPYGSGYKEIKEGMYDSLTRRLTKMTIDKWKKDFEANPKIKQSVLDIDIDEEDNKGRPIEFNYVAQLTFDKKEDGYTVDGTSNSGEEEDKYAFIATIFKVNPEVLPQAWSKIYMDVIDVIRHEIEHLTQSGENVRPGKYKEDDIQIRDMINQLKVLPKKNYYLLDKEVEAMLQGLYLKAKKSKKPFKDVVNNYLDNAPGIDTPEDKEMILNLWRSRRKALSLPVLEQNEKVMDYEIYSDMDGVLTDFDASFEKVSGGIPPRKYEDKYGKDKFWEIIDRKGVGYWVGMPWMSDGKQYWDYIKQYNPILLSSPSRSQTSRLGKRLWVRNQLPGTKLILAQAKDKQNYARKNRILIDDRKSNIDEWRAQGGIGILHTSAADTIKQLKELGL